MKLLFAIVQTDDAKRLTKALNKHRIGNTRISTVGGFLHGGNTTFMIGVDDDKLDEALEVIKEQSSTRKAYTVIPSSLPGYADHISTPVQVTLGGATVFVVNVEDSFKF
ncbi:MAG: cyclic-di-AMP receptor [Clostridia bacterium]|nr:cyclic-di-AMP receptor [Clostridia bacterium]